MLNSNMELTLKQRGFKVSFMLESSILHKGALKQIQTQFHICIANLVTLAGQQQADTGAI